MKPIFLMLTLMTVGCTKDSNTAAKKQPTTDLSVSTPPSSAPGKAWAWHRTLQPEPDPAAKGLYRRMLDQLAAGDVKGAQGLANQIQQRYPQSRFATRLSIRGASSAAVVAAIGLAAATLGPLLLSR